MIVSNSAISSPYLTSITLVDRNNRIDKFLSSSINVILAISKTLTSLLAL
jgi:hypothetical protein